MSAKDAGREPQRIRRSRARGWRLPAGAICVDRSTPWGNPFVVGRDGDAAYCVTLHRHLLQGFVCVSVGATVGEQMTHRKHVAEHIEELRGHDLACWCQVGRPCHADTLLMLANQPEPR